MENTRTRRSGSSGGLTRYILVRIATSLITVLGLASLVFLMVKMIPGDEAQIAAGPTASPEQVEAVRNELGLNEPLYVQYLRYMGRLIQGDLGTSITTRQPVSAELAQVAPATVELIAWSCLLMVALAIAAGTFAAFRLGRPSDAVSRVFAVVAAGLPIFWLALAVQYVVGSQLGWFPISGQLSFGLEVPRVTGMTSIDALLSGNLVAFSDALAHLVLPAAVLAVPLAGQLFRTVRSVLGNVLNQEMVAVIRAKGVSEPRLALAHVLPNGFSPIANMTGLLFGVMIGSAVLVESVFGRPGIGDYLSAAVLHKDTLAVLGTVLFVGTIIIAVNAAVDVVQLVVDPRVRATELSGATR